MDIKVGEYIRTRNGDIGKLEQIVKGVADEYDYILTNTLLNYCGFLEEIEKHSFNIIDLIEVGDYVNGHLVVDLDKNIYNQKLVITEVDGKDGAIRHHYLEKSIKSIVTSEQFEAMEYEV